MRARLATSTITLVLGLGIPGIAVAHDPITTQITWNRDISRIIYKRCASCHHDGGKTFSLMSYQVARPWAKAMKEEVLERRMPPFAAVKGFGVVKDEDALTQEELHIIADWVEGGSPEGDDPKLLPKQPEFVDAKSGPPMAAKADAGSTLDKSADQLIDGGSLTLKEPVTLIGARPVAMAEGGSVQAVAQTPDGSIQPLIWIYDYKSKFDRAYYFEKPLVLPAGSTIRLYPAGGERVALLQKK